MRLVEADAIKAEIQDICDNCWHPYRLGGCPEHCGINDAVKAIDSALPVDAVPVRYGRWVMMEGELAFWDECSECGKKILHRTPYYDFCPNCGANMRKDGEQHGQTE